MSLKIPEKSKDPDEILDYIIDWATRHLGDDTIASSTWAADSTRITIDSDTNTTTTTTVWLSGGTIKEYYTVTNTIITAGGRTLIQSVKIHMELH